MLAPAVQHLAVNFVRQQGHVGVLFKAGHEFVNFGLGRDAAGGVGRAVDDDKPCGRRDLCQHRVGVKGKVVVLAQRNGHRRGAAVLNYGFVNRKARVGVHDFGPRLAKHQHRKKHGGFTAGYHHHAVGVNAGAMAALQVGRYGLAQCGNAVGRGVAVVSVAQRGNTGLHHVRRGLKVGLANT